MPTFEEILVPGPTPRTLTLAQDEDLRAFRELLQGEGYGNERLEALTSFSLGEKALDPTALDRRTREPSRFHTLVRLFLLARDEPADRVQEHLGRELSGQLQRMGLLCPSAEGLRAEAALVPLGETFLLRDFWPHVSGRAKTAHHALGVGKATVNLAEHTVRRQGERVLDVGTGTGYQALLAAPHGASVVGTDTNPRALSFASFNARLAGYDHVSFRQGSLFEPVIDDRFDLIVANPPFVISPDTNFVYRDGGLPGDDMSRCVIEGAAERLAPGGFASVIFNWHSASSETVEARPRSWIEGRGCDAWLLRFHHDDPIAYASTWLRDEEGGDPAAYAERLERWLHYFEREGMHHLHWGILVLRKRERGDAWFRFDERPALDRDGACGEQLRRMFDGETALRSHDDSPLDLRLRLTPEHRLEMHLAQQAGGGFSVTSQVLRQTCGYPFTGNLDGWVAGLVEACVGERSLRDIAREKAQAHGIDLEAMLGQTEAVFRALVRLGYFELSPGV